MKSTQLLFIFCLFFAVNTMAQPGYKSYSQTQGLKLGTKWANAKDENGEKKPALLLALENTNTKALNFSIELRMYYEGVLKETGMIEDMCLLSLKSSIGKLNGLYFIPQKFTPEQLTASDFHFEIDLVYIEEVEACPTEE